LSNTYHISPNDWQNIIFRLCFALLVGGIIGLERQLQHKSAGLRTHMLVSFAAALFTIIPLQSTMLETDSNALSRVIQGVTAGVGFLGAGEILRESSQKPQRPEIRGLTSAAAIWVCAALGIAAGCGLWQLGLIGAILCFLVLFVVRQPTTNH
jgi:putative Mg2+ transporter-C (MgtC) family protein